MLLEMALVGLPIAAVATTSASTGLWNSPLRLLSAAALALMYLGFGVASAHDYLAWNRSRWEAGRSLIADKGIPPTEIDGGFEFNSYFYWRDRRSGTNPIAEILRDTDLDLAHSGPKSEHPTRLIISLSELSGFDPVYRVSVDHWLPLSPSEVLILKRSAESPLPAENHRPRLSR